MDTQISIPTIYDKNLNFLIGSGASAGLFPTLALKIKNEFDETQTVETVATALARANKEEELAWLMLHYYASCIRPAAEFSDAKADTDQKKAVINNYEHFLRTVLAILQRRKSLDRRCNIFTTNYDGCIADAADRILKSGTDDFVVNDGARGFRRRFVHTQNFSGFLCQSGVFERSLTGIPQINLIHLHGSVFWNKTEDGIQVDYTTKRPNLVADALNAELADVAAVLMDSEKCISDFSPTPMDAALKSNFLSAYTQLPVISPTKWKFHETVFEEHYYQMLRLLSYELEKPASVLITFGFSFADEHILNLLKRSLSNPELQVFVCCYSQGEQERLGKLFHANPNVACIGLPDGHLDFTAFNERVFQLASMGLNLGTQNLSGTSQGTAPDDGDPAHENATISGATGAN